MYTCICTNLSLWRICSEHFLHVNISTFRTDFYRCVVVRSSYTCTSLIAVWARVLSLGALVQCMAFGILINSMTFCTGKWSIWAFKRRFKINIFLYDSRRAIVAIGWQGTIKKLVFSQSFCMWSHPHAHRHQMSPLLYASQNGHLPLVELLLSAQADIHKQDSREWTVSTCRECTKSMCCVGVEQCLN